MTELNAHLVSQCTVYNPANGQGTSIGVRRHVRYHDLKRGVGIPFRSWNSLDDGVEQRDQVFKFILEIPGTRSILRNRKKNGKLDLLFRRI